MAYIDKIFWHDQNDRDVLCRNHDDGWIGDWDIDKLTLRSRWSGDEGKSQNCVSIEVWKHGSGDPVEIILDRQQALRLAQKLQASVYELNNEDQFEYWVEKLQNLENKVERKLWQTEEKKPSAK